MFALRNESGTVTEAVINRILDLKPNVNLQNKQGWTALMLALSNKSGTVTETVINRILDLNPDIHL